MNKTLRDLIVEYFKMYPNRDIEHGPVVDWVSEQWIKTHTTPPRDPWRMIRKLHQEGLLIKVKKGVYRYEPEGAKDIVLMLFSAKQKEVIFKRDGYKCVVCGRGREDGIEIVADHRISKDKAGTNDISNGQTLCTEHNLLKKNYSQTEAGKRFFIKMYEKAVSANDERMIRFCKSVFDVYNEYSINSHYPAQTG